MVKWYHVYKMMRYCANVLTHDYAINLADESARLRFTAVKWRRGAMATWYHGNVATNCHSSSAPETIRACGRAGSWYSRAGELESCELRAGAATKNLT